MKTKTTKIVEKNQFPTSYYLGFDPYKDTPNTPQPELCGNCGKANEADPSKRKKCSACGEELVYPSQYRRFTTALTNAFYAQKTQHHIGAGVKEVLKHVDHLRPYRVYQEETDKHAKSVAPRGISFPEFDEQCQSIYNIVHCLSSYGELQLAPELFPFEFGV